MTVRMKAPEGGTELNFNGIKYGVVDGFVSVPKAAAAALSGHGYSVAGEDDSPDEKAKRTRRTKAQMEAAAMVVKQDYPTEVAAAEAADAEDSRD